MDIKDLNKSQLILLTLLVSFVTSIATGITTVSLLEQAPPAVSRTINHVVERTIEKVVPGTSKTDTIVIRQDDLIVNAVSKNTPSLGVIRTKETADAKSNILGVGFVISNDGYFVTDSGLVSGTGSYEAVIDGNTFPLALVKQEKESALLKADLSQQKNIKNLSAVTFGKSANVKVGQTVVALTRDPVAIAQGIVSEILQSEGTKEIPSHVTEIKVGETLASRYDGAPVFDVDGSVIGMIVKDETGYKILSEAELIQPEGDAKSANLTK